MLDTFEDGFILPSTQVRLNEKIGEGSFGEVWYGEWNCRQIAGKTFKKGSMTKEEFVEEAKQLRKMQHLNIVQFYGLYLQEDRIFIITEYMRNGSLSSYLKNFKTNLQFDNLLYISQQIADGMCYLEGQNIIHRDLACRNVLVGEKNITKICDFGLARNQGYHRKQSSTCSIRWSAPENIFSHIIASTKGDVWSFGVVLWEIFSYGEGPYCDMSDEEVIRNVKNGYRLKKPDNANESIFTLMSSCWNVDAEKRPSFSIISNYLNML